MLFGIMNLTSKSFIFFLYMNLCTFSFVVLSVISISGETEIWCFSKSGQNYWNLCVYVYAKGNDSNLYGSRNSSHTCKGI